MWIWDDLGCESAPPIRHPRLIGRIRHRSDSQSFAEPIAPWTNQSGLWAAQSPRSSNFPPLRPCPCRRRQTRSLHGLLPAASCDLRPASLLPASPEPIPRHRRPCSQRAAVRPTTREGRARPRGRCRDASEGQPVHEHRQAPAMAGSDGPQATTGGGTSAKMGSPGFSAGAGRTREIGHLHVTAAAVAGTSGRGPMGASGRGRQRAASSRLPALTRP